MSTPRLELTDISAHFDGITVLDGLSLSLAPGELRFLIGPNGAGKTTLLDVITGKTRPDHGSVTCDGRQLLGLQEHQIARLGIGRKFQTPSVFAGLSVRQNIEVALGGHEGLLSALLRMSTRDRELVDQTLDLIGLRDRHAHPAAQLSHGERQWLEIGMLLAQEPRVLLLDEPVAGMSRPERDRTADLVHRIQEVHPDNTLLIVEHDMTFVRQLATTVTVLHLGSVLSEGSIDDVQGDPRVISAYLGHGRRAAA
jgi:urea transport system ATP-binding protein